MARSVYVQDERYVAVPWMARSVYVQDECVFFNLFNYWSSPLFIDSHCHLDRLNLSLYEDNLANVVQAASAAKVTKILCVSVTLKDFPAMVEQTKAFNNVLLSCGMHPLNQDDEVDVELLRTLADNSRVIAIGETGLDYHYAPETKALQLDSFKKHIAVAKALINR